MADRDPLARADALLAAADLTRGPWTSQHWDCGATTVGSVVTPQGSMTRGDAVLAAAARELLPALVERVRAAEAHARLMQRERDAFAAEAARPRAARPPVSDEAWVTILGALADDEGGEAGR